MKENNWVDQKEGTINKDDDSIPGTQPTKDLHQIIRWFFYTSSDHFAEEIYNLIKSGGIKTEIEIEVGEEPIMSGSRSLTPYVNSHKQLKLHESFISYVWCIAYSCYILYNEEVSYPQINYKVGYEKYKQSPEEIGKAYNVLRYGLSLLKVYTPWDKENLPNPEVYDVKHRNYIEQSNIMCTEAIKWILVHEYTHIRDHIDQMIAGKSSDPHIFQYEKEADENATKMVLKGIKNDSQSIFSEGGIIVAILCLFYFRKETTSIKYPDTEDRLTNALEIIDADPENYIWGMACVGLTLWSQQYNLGIDFKKEVKDHKELYYYVIGQIKALK